MKCMRVFSAVVLLVLAIVASAESDSDSGNPTDIIFYNGVIHTMDDQRKISSAVAISGNRILGVGADKDILAMKKPDTRLIDLQQRMVLPGLFDTHAHVGLSAYYTAACSLHSATAKAELVQLMKGCAADYKGEGWLWGFGFSPQALGAVDFSLQELDAVFPDIPIAMVAIQHDYLFVNSAGLLKMGYGKQEGDLTRPDFVRDAHGRPTARMLGDSGVLRLGLFEDFQGDSALAFELNKLLSLGYTSFFDAGIFVDDYADRLRAFKHLYKQGQPAPRANLSVVLGMNGGEPNEQVLSEYVSLARELDSPRIKLQTIKVFGDFEPHMVEPYASAYQGAHNAHMQLSPELLAIAVEAGSAAGFSIYMHAMGDGTVRSALDVFEQFKAERQPGTPRHTLSHLTFVHPDDLPRFKELDVVANISPVWAYPNSQSYMTGPEPIPGWMGTDRAGRIMAFRDIYDNGATVTSSSDYPYSALSPFEGIEVGITRKHPGRESAAFIPEQGLSLDAMLESYTRNAAYEFGQEGLVGTLEPGKLADLIVLDQNLYNIEPEKISDTRVVLTVVDGDIVYRSDD